MEGSDLTAIYTTIGNVLGTPAALVVFWVVSQIKDLKTKVKILEKENASLKECLTNIRVDVSWMRGNMEGKETKDA